MASKKILLADDEGSVRMLVALTLKGEGQYEILEANDGIEALEITRRELPDLLLLDVLMPHCDGFEVCAQLKGDPRTKEIPIVLLTALNQEKDKLKGREAGADGFFTKPFSPTALLDRINSLLGK